MTTLPPGGNVDANDQIIWQRHEDIQRRQYAAAIAASGMQGMNPAILAYVNRHLDLLADAKHWIVENRDDLAIIIACTAFEVRLARAVDELVGGRNLPHIEMLRSNPSKDFLLNIYKWLGAPDIRKAKQWKSYTELEKLRNAVVHRANPPPAGEAKKLIDELELLITNFDSPGKP